MDVRIIARKRIRALAYHARLGFMRCLLLILLSAVAALGQGRPPIFSPQPFAQLRAYLVLTDSQFQTINRNNAEYSNFVQEKQLRNFQVQREIAQQTAASPLDPLGLGLRYAELETICRQIRDKGEEVSAKNMATLTDAQKTKMKALDEALRLLPIYSEAQSAGLVSGTLNIPFFYNGAPTGSFARFLLGSPLACQSNFVPGFRTGDFTPDLP